MPIRTAEGDIALRYHRAMATLAPIPRLIFFLRCKDEFSFPDIAFRLGWTVLEVEAQFASAIAHLDELMNGPG